MIKLKWELTDTFGGEANYSWAKRGELIVKTNTTRAIIRAVKKACERDMFRHKPIEEYGDMIRIDFYGLCNCVFITDFEEVKQ